ncbi:hypothetical protein SODALDRAFT_381842 [Sodiomyces alkalinus F11]|uniref:Uncharacterized protein n=1 Tax=Sodiomyces alkalinus (strain CBS 110278 / VKM F-3762 / F11) TaxID=1314773 RepID=A0A3N2PKL6_SODAK|nr:hypothetical protein SODALDRAFT_381842 [Sodiomyces alkalinus F11]ROT34866.1 hypothetical protein SODALDRAFT_381842 [Sodiomyces alkalinus F11]
MDPFPMADMRCDRIPIIRILFLFPDVDSVVESARRASRSCDLSGTTKLGSEPHRQNPGSSALRHRRLSAQVIVRRVQCTVGYVRVTISLWNAREAKPPDPWPYVTGVVDMVSIGRKILVRDRGGARGRTMLSGFPVFRVRSGPAGVAYLRVPERPALSSTEPRYAGFQPQKTTGEKDIIWVQGSNPTHRKDWEDDEENAWDDTDGTAWRVSKYCISEENLLSPSAGVHVFIVAGQKMKGSNGSFWDGTNKTSQSSWGFWDMRRPLMSGAEVARGHGLRHVWNILSLTLPE